jgi:PHD/YefM family antitoxin component YafN of YafNO toxin-antitoxin module
MPVKVLDSNKARTRWRDILDMVGSGREDVVVLRYREPTVAVIAYGDYVALREQLDDLRAARRATEAYEAWKQEPGRAKPWQEVEEELIAEGLLDEVD